MNILNQNLSVQLGQTRYVNSIGTIAIFSFYCSIGKTDNQCTGFILEAKGYVDISND